MFAYLISKLLCNIYQSLDVRSDKSAPLERTKTSFGLRETLRETYLESLLKLLVRKNYLLCVYRDLNCIHNPLRSRFSKSTERPKQKNISLESSLKAPDSLNYSSSDLTKCASKIPTQAFCVFKEARKGFSLLYCL